MFYFSILYSLYILVLFVLVLDDLSSSSQLILKGGLLVGVLVFDKVTRGWAYKLRAGAVVVWLVQRASKELDLVLVGLAHDLPS